MAFIILYTRRIFILIGKKYNTRYIDKRPLYLLLHVHRECVRRFFFLTIYFRDITRAPLSNGELTVWKNFVRTQLLMERDMPGRGE